MAVAKTAPLLERITGPKGWPRREGWQTGQRAGRRKQSERLAERLASTI